jgi:cytidylate kinase
MYRAVTLKVLRKRIDPEDLAGAEAVARSVRIEFNPSDDGLRVFLDGEDVTSEIRGPEVTRHVSAVSRIRGVREAMVRLQRQMGAAGGVVLEGRDIGTVVFPDADLKIYMTASLDERVKRRGTELRTTGKDVHPQHVRQEIDRRDMIDSTREESPLVKASDAIELDTSGLTIDEQVEFVVRQAERVLEERT